MTIPVQRPRKIISGSGWANPLVHDYPIENVTDVGVFADSEELTLGVHYSVSGVGDPTGYTVTITSPEDWSPAVWVLDVQYPINQPSDVDQGGQFGARFEAALDRMARSDQVVYERARRSLAVDRTTPLDAEVSLPAAEANSLLGWTSDGAGLENKGSIPQIQIVAANIASIVTTAENIAAILTVAAEIDDVTTVGGIAADVTTVANSASQVGVVAGIAPQVVAVAGVADDLADVIDNMESIQNASANAQAAEEARDKAEEWAESPDEIEPGKRSAKYWAEIADAVVNLPIGTVIDIYGDGSTSVPGYLLCNGAPVTAAYPALRAFGLANGWPVDGNGDPLLPDSGGRVKRGWLPGQTIDSGRVFGTTQEDQMQGHRHLYEPSSGIRGVSSPNGTVDILGGGGVADPKTDRVTSVITDGTNGTPRVGDETRMHNYTVTQWIKAYDVAQTDTTGMDLAEIANDVSAVQVEVTNLPFHKFYESAEQTITAAGLLTLAHGLGAAPKLLQAFIVCKTAEAGYSVGDVVALGPVDITGSATSSRGYSAKVNSTNIVIRYGATANTILIVHGTDGSGFGVTNANWRFIVRAWA